MFCVQSCREPAAGGNYSVLQEAREKSSPCTSTVFCFTQNFCGLFFMLFFAWFLLLAEGNASDRLVPSVTGGSTSTYPEFDFLDKTIIHLYIAAVNPEPMPKNWNWKRFCIQETLKRGVIDKVSITLIICRTCSSSNTWWPLWKFMHLPQSNASRYNSLNRSWMGKLMSREAVWWWKD